MFLKSSERLPWQQAGRSIYVEKERSTCFRLRNPRLKLRLCAENMRRIGEVMKCVEQLLSGKGSNHILPFLWMHGESKDILREEVERIAECKIKEICLESRPYPGYCTDRWFDDLGFLIEEAKKNDMKLWILDDDKFPTGHANGGFAKHPELAKVYLAERHMDIIGPARDGAVLVSPFLGKDGKLISILAFPKPDTDTLDVSEQGVIDLTDRYYDDFVHFDLPEGRYRLFVLFTTRQGGGRQEYMNLIDAASVRVLIDEVYETHYKKFGHEFGKTILGFFTDEPELGNTAGYSFTDMLGKGNVRLPWSDELKCILEEKWGADLAIHLISLWYSTGSKTGVLRSEYMDAVTSLVDRCFAGQIGTWCSNHKVEYIGHIIEDDNAHARLGCSIGHYFRAQKGQHMSGIDVVHHQIVPGFTERIHQWIAGDADGEFFHFGLAKLGSSLAHIDVEKKGRALCEIFGNYGWAEGVSLMKWLTDHMLVRGINEFVPHAFSPLFPDRDCPPHFYARGNNPQFRAFSALMKYMNRMAHLLSDGVHVADALLLYHAEAEWSGGKTQLFQVPMRALLEEQLDADVISADLLLEGNVSVKNGRWLANKESYGCLILPYADYIPVKAVAAVIEGAKNGGKVYMTDRLPLADTAFQALPKAFLQAVTVVPLNQLTETIRKQQLTEMKCSTKHKDLRFYCYIKEGCKVYYFFNESITEVINTSITIQHGRYTMVTEYNAMDNTAESFRVENQQLTLQLHPGEAKIFLFDENICSEQQINIYKQNCTVQKKRECKETTQLDLDWKVSISAAGKDMFFTEKLRIPAEGTLPNMNSKGYFTNFSGTFRYEGNMLLDKGKEDIYRLTLPRIGDTAEVFINGLSAGMILQNHGMLNITDFLISGNNHITIDVTNTLVWMIKDGASTHLQVDATGLLKAPVLQIY